MLILNSYPLSPNCMTKTPLITAICTFFGATSALFGQYTDAINSNRPGLSQSGFSVGKTVFQTELGVTYNNRDHQLHKTGDQGFNSELNIRYGAFLEQLEFQLRTSHQISKFYSLTDNWKTSGFEKVGLGAKYLVFDPYKQLKEQKPNLYSWKANHRFKFRDLVPAVALAAHADLKASSAVNPEDFPSLALGGYLITHNSFGRMVLVTNWGVRNFSSKYETYEYIVTLTYGLNSDWSVFVENHGLQSDPYGDLIFRAGLAFLLRENLQLDGNAGMSAKNTPSNYTVGIGLSWRFDGNYEDVWLRAPNKEEEKSEMDKKMEKANKKKRKDQVDPADLE